MATLRSFVARFAEPVGLDLPVDVLLRRLESALDGTGPALLPIPVGAPPGLFEAARLDYPVADDTALLLPTSGSTGAPKLVELSATALLASARATHQRIGPPARWLLALPLTHVAGWQVLVRGLLSTAPVPVILDRGQTFSAEGLLDAVATAPDVRYVSLVPTQLARLLSVSPTALTPVAAMTILLGGAAAPDALLRRARDAGLQVIATYGSTETSGGCIYNGRPLSDVRVRLQPDGRLALTGPMLATGYRGPVDHEGPADAPDDARTPFEHDAAGVRWFVTNDLAEIATGRVRIVGRADDVIITGGEKVHPAEVERVLATLQDVTESVVVGVPDPQWGQQVVALVVTPRLDTDRWRREAAGQLPPYAWPRRFIQVTHVPMLGVGKPDRHAGATLATPSEKDHLYD